MFQLCFTPLQSVPLLLFLSLFSASTTGKRTLCLCPALLEGRVVLTRVISESVP